MLVPRNVTPPTGNLPRDDGKDDVRGSFPIHEDGIRRDAGPQPEPLGFACVRVQIEMGKIAA